jgi:serine/threonine protein kinase
VSQHPEERDVVAAWVGARVRNGRLPADIGEQLAHPDFFIALQREARRASMLAHPNVVTVYDFDRDGSRIYMTMEYLEGRPRDRYLSLECAEGCALPTAWPIIRGIGAALAYGHQKRIIHSDLKPATSSSAATAR